jgi:hypothetical protein
VKDWESIADNLKKAGWSWGCVSAIDSNGRTIWIVDAHRDDGKGFVARAEEKLTAFVELESAIQATISCKISDQYSRVTFVAWERQFFSRLRFHLLLCSLFWLALFQDVPYI